LGEETKVEVSDGGNLPASIAPRGLVTLLAHLPDGGASLLFAPFGGGAKNNDGIKDGWFEVKPNPKVWRNEKSSTPNQPCN
jgi:hypothetical protein